MALEQQINRFVYLLRQAEGCGEVVAGAQRYHAERHGLESAVHTGDAIDRLVQRPIAAGDEEMVVTVLDRLGGRVAGVTF